MAPATATTTPAKEPVETCTAAPVLAVAEAPAAEPLALPDPPSVKPVAAAVLEPVPDAFAVPEADAEAVEDDGATDLTVMPAPLQVSAKELSAADWSLPEHSFKIDFWTSEELAPQTEERSAGLGWVLSAARRHAGGCACATCAAAKRERTKVPLNCILKGST